MPEDKKETIIFQAEQIEGGQIRVTLHNRNINLLCTASRLLNLEIDNMIIGNMNKSKPQIVPATSVPKAVLESLRR